MVPVAKLHQGYQQPQDSSTPVSMHSEVCLPLLGLGVGDDELERRRLTSDDAFTPMVFGVSHGVGVGGHIFLRTYLCHHIKLHLQQTNHSRRSVASAHSLILYLVALFRFSPVPILDEQAICSAFEHLPLNQISS